MQSFPRPMEWEWARSTGDKEMQRLIVLICAGLAVATPVLARSGGGGGFGGVGGISHGGGFGNFSLQRSPAVVRPHVIRNRVVVVPPLAHRFLAQPFAVQRFGRGGVPATTTRSLWWPFGFSVPITAAVSAAASQNEPYEPQIIIFSSSLPRIVSDVPAPQDFGYVLGCRAIPNGYHCDTLG